MKPPDSILSGMSGSSNKKSGLTIFAVVSMVIAVIGGMLWGAFVRPAEPPACGKVPQADPYQPKVFGIPIPRKLIPQSCPGCGLG